MWHRNVSSPLEILWTCFSDLTFAIAIAVYERALSISSYWAPPNSVTVNLLKSKEQFRAYLVNVCISICDLATIDLCGTIHILQRQTLKEASRTETLPVNAFTGSSFAYWRKHKIHAKFQKFKFKLERF